MTTDNGAKIMTTGWTCPVCGRGVVLFAVAALALAACAGPAPEPHVVTQRVEVPVPVARTPPPELLSAALPAFPAVVFVPAGSPDAAVGVTPTGRDALVSAIAKAKTIIAAWRAWATAE